MPFLDIKIGDLERNINGLDGLFSHSARIGIPTDFPLQGLNRAQVDLEILATKLRQNNTDVRMLLQAFVEGNNVEVDRLVRQLGLRESDFQEQGGGIFWAIVIVGVLCCASEAR